ncbi:MAG: hypothetical protein PHC88_01535 [Terrimicrobiaceae bacterium]|nr:hypothetical protein [Terrimicrobiaceae bacterium]
MMPRASILALALTLGAMPVRAAESRDGLMFSLNSALMSRDRAAFARCVNFTGADEATRTAFAKIIDQIFAWPGHYVFTSERSGQGNPDIEQNGRKYTLNGDWKFQVHVFLSKTTSKGFVFPAGSVNGQFFILVAIPAKP